MGKIYVNQTALTIELDTNEDITGSTCLIKYRKPSGTEGSWSATITDATNGIIEYEVSADDIDEAGRWVFWAYVTFSNGTKLPGEAVIEEIYEEGE